MDWQRNRKRLGLSPISRAGLAFLELLCHDQGGVAARHVGRLVVHLVHLEREAVNDELLSRVSVSKVGREVFVAFLVCLHLLEHLVRRHHIFVTVLQLANALQGRDEVEQQTARDVK